jgi:hypothetical protein
MTQLSGFYTIFFKRTDKYDNKYYAVPKSLFDKVEQVCEDLQLKNGCISPFQPEPDGKTFYYLKTKSTLPENRNRVYISFKPYDANLSGRYIYAKFDLNKIEEEL